ncbi:MAG: alcohol dehydrogenase catalytic domain-containing protein [Bryobacterales bacterium]|nr:alcohol dehydrogenase catalytic domain-containing protein [Bryobacterales bacterium]
MPKMKAVQVNAARQFEVVEREIPAPGAGQLRIRVEACGVCHSDVVVKEAVWPGLELPRIPGHEVAGVIDAVGSGVANWREGQRVGVGWFGGNCGYCDSCRRGDFVLCRNMLIAGVSYDGGYAEYMVAPASAVAKIPDDLGAMEAAPLLCAGVTTFNPLRQCGARPGDVVAVQGVGGLGHLGVQFAAKMGYTTVAIARGKDKEAEARQLGAHHYIDGSTQDVAAALQALGGARVILTTVTNADAMSGVIGGLASNGTLVIVGISQEPLKVSTLDLILGRRSVLGWPSGTSLDSQDALAFSARQGVRPMIETMPLERAAEAYERMMSGKARFRMVLTMGRM